MSPWGHNFMGDRGFSSRVSSVLQNEACVIEIVTGFIKNSSGLLSAGATRVVFHVNKSFFLVSVFKLCGHRSGIWKLKICCSIYHQFF